MACFLFGPAHPRWKGGKTLNTDGYIRITAGLNRDKLEHRVVANNCLLESLGRPLRADEEVHHQNFIRTCNHNWNLIIMDEALHHGISGDRPGRWKEKRKKHGKRKSSSRFQKHQASYIGTDGQRHVGAWKYSTSVDISNAIQPRKGAAGLVECRKSASGRGSGTQRSR